MGKQKFQAPDLANATPTYLVDELGSIREQLANLKKMEGFLKEALLARSDGKIAIEGEIFVAAITDRSQQRLDTAGLKEEFGPEWYEDHTKTIEFKEVRTTRLPE